MFGRVNYKKNIQGLLVIQTVYAFIMALGLGEIFNAFPVIFESAALYETRLFTLPFIVIGSFLCAIVLVGIRFFWVPRNLRELTVVVSKCIAHSGAQGGTVAPEESIKNILFPFHIVVILVHAALFYHMCVEFNRLIYLYAAQEFLTLRDLNAVVVTFVVLLLTNAAWLIFIQRQIDTAYETAALTPSPGARPGSVWWKNNLIAAIAALTLHTTYVTCGAAARECVSANGAFSTRFLEFIPASPEDAGQLIELLFGSRADASSDMLVALIIVAVLLWNSVFDLWRTGASYLIFDDIEWSGGPDGAPSDPGKES